MAELAPYVGRFSQRASPIARNVDRYEAAWRTDHPGKKPGPRLRQSWDRRAWADARPDKVVPTGGAALVTAWNEELHDLDFRAPISTDGREPRLKNLDRSKVPGPSIGAVNRDAAAELILTRLGARRSAWNPADIRGEAEKLTATLGIVAQRVDADSWVVDVDARDSEVA